jgi:hypothetical protein
MVVLEVELRASCMDILSYSKQQKKKKNTFSVPEGDITLSLKVTAINKTLRFGPGESYEGLAILG